MSAEDLKQRILAWCHESDDLDVREPDAGDRDFALDIDAHDHGQYTVSVVKERGQAWITLAHHMATDAAEHLEEFLVTRPAPLDGTAEEGGVSLHTQVWLDGLTRQSFMVALHELSRSHDGLEQFGERRREAAAAAAHSADGAHAQPAVDSSLADLSGARAGASTATGFQGMGAQRPDGEDAAGESTHFEVMPAPVVAEPVASWPSPQQASTAPEPSPAVEEPAPVHQLSSFERAFQPQPVATPVPAAEEDAAKPMHSWGTREMGAGANSREPEPTPVAAEQAWSPTHTVPPTGMPAWAAPDPAQPPVARLDPQLRVRVTETAGGWAHILCSNGWAAWVDARLLIQG